MPRFTFFGDQTMIVLFNVIYNFIVLLRYYVCTQEKRIKIYQICILVFSLLTLTIIYVQVNHIL